LNEFLDLVKNWWKDVDYETWMEKFGVVDSDSNKLLSWEEYFRTFAADNPGDVYNMFASSYNEGMKWEDWKRFEEFLYFLPDASEEKFRDWFKSTDQDGSNSVTWDEYFRISAPAIKGWYENSEKIGNELKNNRAHVAEINQKGLLKQPWCIE